MLIRTLAAIGYTILGAVCIVVFILGCPLITCYVIGKWSAHEAMNDTGKLLEWLPGAEAVEAARKLEDSDGK